MIENCTNLREAVRVRQAMTAYRDEKYIALIRQINSRVQEITTDDMGTKFLQNCGRDLAGEIVRNCFDTSDFYITVDQLATRIFSFSYDDEYDPLSKNQEIQKNVYNYNDLSASSLDKINAKIDANQEKLFTETRKMDSLDRKGKLNYRKSKLNANGHLYDELTGEKGDYVTVTINGKDTLRSDLHADHIQSREAASYNSRYIKDSGKDALKDFWNSNDNMQMMHASANTSKGDVRVCKVNGEIKYYNTKDAAYDSAYDITHRATPEQLVEATVQQWEKSTGTEKTKILKEKGFLNEDGKVPKSVRKELEKNINHSQNAEGFTVLKYTNYGEAATAVGKDTAKSMGRIIAGQLLYYAAPPLVYEVRNILKNRTIKLNNALENLTKSGRRICRYVYSHIKNIFTNIVVGSVKSFIKSFMNLLIGLVKATVRKVLKLAKSLVLSTVDAIRIITTPGKSKAEKADAVFNLYGITITTVVVDLLFDLLENGVHIPQVLLLPLQILVTVVCTNFTMLILEKADLFDVHFGFKINEIKKVFTEERARYDAEMAVAEQYTSDIVDRIIENAKAEGREIYNELVSLDPKMQSVRGTLERINTMFNMNIDFEEEWLNFIGMKAVTA